MSDIKSLKLSETGGVRIRKGRKLWLLIFVLILVGIFFWTNSSTSSVFRYVLGKGSSLQMENERINVLLLGMAGGTHDGPTLTDTIMVASFNNKTNKVNLISLPRDLWLDLQKSKVNALYEKGLSSGNGLKYAEDNFGNILGIKIPYAIRLNFSGFIKAVDLVEGIDVVVINSFNDYLYPVEGKENDYCGLEEKNMDIGEEQSKQLGLEKGEHQVLIDSSGKIATASATVGGKIVYGEDNVGIYFPCRYERITFTKGLTHMDGTTALKFVRSRHGLNGEGSDFARSRRQQLVLQAFKEKLLSVDTFTDVSKMVGLMKTFGESIETDIPESQYLEFAGLIKRVKEVKSTVINSEGINPLLINPPVEIYGVWALTPPNNDFSAIHNFLTDVLNETDTATRSGELQNQKP